MICPVCRREVERRKTTGPSPKLHKACSEMRRFLRAARKAAGGVEFAPGGAGRIASTTLNAQLADVRGAVVKAPVVKRRPVVVKAVHPGMRNHAF